MGSLALLAGLSVNVGLSLLLLPSLGLLGAPVAAGAAHLVALVLILGFSRRLGFRSDPGTWIVLSVPAVFWLGPWATMAVLIAIVFEAITTNRILTAEEKGHLLQAWLRYRQRFLTTAAWWRSLSRGRAPGK